MKQKCIRWPIACLLLALPFPRAMMVYAKGWSTEAVKEELVNEDESQTAQSGQAPKIYERLKESDSKAAWSRRPEEEWKDGMGAVVDEEGSKTYFEWADSALFQRLTWIAQPDSLNTSFRENVRTLVRKSYIRSEILEFLSRPYASDIRTKDSKQFTKDVIAFAEMADIDAIKQGSMEKRLILSNEIPELDLGVILFAEEMLKGSLQIKRGNGMIPVRNFDPHLSGVIMLRMLFEHQMKLQPRQMDRIIRDFALLYLMDKLILIKMEKDGPVEHKSPEVYSEELMHARRTVAFSRSVLELFIKDIPFDQKSLSPARQDAEAMYPTASQNR